MEGQLDHAEEHLFINTNYFQVDKVDDLIRIIAERKSAGRTTWIPGSGTRPNLKLAGLTWDQLLVFCVLYDEKCAPVLHLV